MLWSKRHAKTRVSPKTEALVSMFSQCACSSLRQTKIENRS